MADGDAPALRGWFVRSETISEAVGERRVLCAVILQAITDAERGDTAAAAWLEDTGRLWCGVLGVAVEGDDWHAAAQRLPVARRELAAENERLRHSTDRRQKRQAVREGRGLALQDG